MWILDLIPPCLPVQPCPQLLQPFGYALPSAWRSFPHHCWLNFYLFFESQLRHRLPWEASPRHSPAPCAYPSESLITLFHHCLFSFLCLGQFLKATWYLVHLCVLIPFAQCLALRNKCLLVIPPFSNTHGPCMSEYMPRQLWAKPSWPLHFIFMGITVFSKYQWPQVLFDLLGFWGERVRVDMRIDDQPPSP